MTDSHASAGGEPADADRIAAIIAAHSSLEGALLPILHALQEAFGHVPAAAHGPVCAALNITAAELHGVITFYHDFRSAPAGRHVLRLCRSEACLAMGAEATASAVLDRLGLDWGGTSAGGGVTVLPVYCLGLCACAPAAQLDGQPMGRIDAAAITARLAAVGA